MTSQQEKNNYSPIKVSVIGALGKMGSEAVRTILKNSELELVGAVAPHPPECSVNSHFGFNQTKTVNFQTDLRLMLQNSRPDVCVELTNPDVVFDNVMAIVASGSRPIIGTTGLTDKQRNIIDQALREKGLGGMLIPNFAIGAVLMMKFAKEAAKYMDHAEIIELHHNQKADAPSGTALKTATLMAESRKNFALSNVPEAECIPGARGAETDAGIRIHSIRLPGLVAHQEVIFGGTGQALSIRHDSIDRTSFMPGVVLAIKKVSQFHGLVYGLEQVL